MKIAVTYENGEVFQHFGHTEQFKLYEVSGGKLLHTQVVDTNGSGHGALAGLLAQLGVDTLICGGIGGGAQAALAEANIRLIGGVQGNADEAVQAFLNGTLAFDPITRNTGMAVTPAAATAAAVTVTNNSCRDRESAAESAVCRRSASFPRRKVRQSACK